MRPTSLFWTSLHDIIFMSIHIHNFTLINYYYYFFSIFWFRYEYIVPLFIVGFNLPFTSIIAGNLLIEDWFFSSFFYSSHLPTCKAILVSSLCLFDMSMWYWFFFYFFIYQVQTTAKTEKLKSEINNANFRSFKTRTIQMNTHLKESFLSHTTQSLAW